MPPSDRQARRRDARAASKARPKRGSRTFLLLLLAIIVGGVALIVVTRTNRARGPEPPPGVRTFEDLPRNHVDTPVEYDIIPPPGGPHAATPATCGYYSRPVRAENVVHSLEHGAIWITYRPDLGEEEIARLRRLAGSKVLVSPWIDGLPAPVVATAWERQLQLQSAEDERLQRFIDVFRDGSQAPEPFAQCTGVGQPE